MSTSMSLQSRFSSDRISYLLSSLLYNYLELDISLIASGLSFNIFDKHSLWSFPYPVSYLVFPLLGVLIRSVWVRLLGSELRVD